ncbi:hypothetical protein CUMW_218960 [Citrus unshiu]|nr:hypothetical protein CUMW_218960 [Citrus unshiu]
MKFNANGTLFRYLNCAQHNSSNNSFMWFGPTRRLNIVKPDQIKEISTKINDFQKINSDPLARLLALALVSHEWENLTSKGGSCELGVRPSLAKLTSDVLPRTASGSN